MAGMLPENCRCPRRRSLSPEPSWLIRNSENAAVLEVLSAMSAMRTLQEVLGSLLVE